MPRRRSATKHELAEHVKKLYQAMYATSRRVPSGHVLTYGQLAELSGLPGGARVAGAALKVSSRYADKPVPWQRIVGKASKTRGRIAIHDPVGAAVQRQLLEADALIKRPQERRREAQQAIELTRGAAGDDFRKRFRHVLPHALLAKVTAGRPKVLARRHRQPSAAPEKACAEAGSGAL